MKKEGESAAHQRARQVLERELERAFDVLDHGDPCYVLDKDFRYVYVNQRQVETVGVSREETLGRVIWDLHPAAANPAGKFWQELHRVMRDRTFSEFETHYAPLGAYYRVHVYPTREGGIAVFFHDITPQKVVEEERTRLLAQLSDIAAEAHRSHGQLEAAFKAIRDGIVVVDMQGNVILTNQREQEMLNVSRAEDVEKDLGEFAEHFEMYTPEGEFVPLESWPAARGMRGESLNTEYMGRDKRTGQTWYVSVSVAPVRDKQGKQFLAVVVTRDITEKKEAEIALRKSEAALREADEHKNEFLAMLSHELRNPLAPIRNSIYVLGRATPGSEQAKRAQQIIERQVDHMGRLIDDLLDVTRISRGKVRLQEERVDLCELARRTAEDLAEVFKKSNVTLEVRVPDAPVHVNGDPTRLSQVIGNLLQNSAKFTQAGGRTRLSVEVEGVSAVINVFDNGAGMTQETLLRLFDPFVQAERTLDRSRGGLGLGLALVRGLVELHGGKVSATSDGLGKGAVFTVRLPLAEPQTRASITEAIEPSEGARRVLVIEDNIDAADTLKEVLEMSGHTVEVAHTGPEGIEKARHFEPDVVLCDIGLPGMDGYGVARSMRADEKLRSVYSVALSGYALQEDVEKAREAGFDRHLAKPPSLAALEKVLSEAPVLRAA